MRFVLLTMALPFWAVPFYWRIYRNCGIPRWKIWHQLRIEYRAIWS